MILLIDIKKWLEDNLNGVKVEETVFRKPPKTPYIVYDDDVTKRGSDERNHIIEHDVVIELYGATKLSIESVSKQIDTLLLDIEYRSFMEYIKEEQQYVKTFSFNLIEKEQ
uniref:DUF3168 domain-containing protein n=1 Tax=Siphoviridae sp. ctGuJ10 TaxID=2825418 RepID=A0A8S5PTS6_9CAUD|nr:MAG TPA: hypothetical protein [Siphoviridae sp. ctGuJ10]